MIHEGFVRPELGAGDMLKVAEKLIPRGRSRDWHNALMDYGAMVVTARVTGIRAKNRQPKFKGSVREARGMLLNRIVEHGVAKKEIISKEQGFSEEVLGKAIRDLLKEGILFEKDGELFLRE